MKPKITVIGSANIDFVMQVGHLPAKGETVVDGRFFQAFGGKGANQAVAAARAGGAVCFVAALGGDLLARTYLDNLRKDGIDTEQVTLEPGIAGGSALVMFDQQGDNYLTVAPGSNYRVTPERVHAAEDLIASSDWIILQQEIPLESNRAVLELAAKHGRPVMLNYAPAHDLRLKPDASVHGLIVNEHEAASLSGRSLAAENQVEAARMATALREKGGHRFVVLTLGKAGSVFADAFDTRAVPAFPVNAVDTTAAGDTFCGSLAVSLGEGRPLPEAVRFASAASALSVTKVGAQSSIPTRSDIDAFLLLH
ncbi:MAG: ribokinase [Opitutaceae bacterium]